MLNIDKYREEIMSKVADAARLDCYIASLRGVGIETCGKSPCKMCMRASFEWLFSEHEPPLLENGDGLKPGDWIMVRNYETQSFVKRQFLYFYENRFFTTRENHTPFDNQTEWYMQAYLPEDDE